MPIVPLHNGVEALTLLLNIEVGEWIVLALDPRRGEHLSVGITRQRLQEHVGTVPHLDSKQLAVHASMGRTLAVHLLVVALAVEVIIFESLPP